MSLKCRIIGHSTKESADGTFVYCTECLQANRIEEDIARFALQKDVAKAYEEAEYWKNRTLLYLNEVKNLNKSLGKKAHLVKRLKKERERFTEDN